MTNIDMRSYKTEGIVLKRKNFGEADRILTVFTKYYGKIVVKAPGVRRITSRRSAHLEVLNLSVFTLYKGSGFFLPIVTDAQVLDESLAIKNSLPRVGLAYYICELVDRLCPDNQENKKTFYLIKDALFKLANGLDKRSVVDDFENDLLVTLGFLPKHYRLADKKNFIENILERKLYTKRLLPLFLHES